MGSSVYALKNITKIERPDGSSNNSFPSGHTATAFAGAEFLWQEYKDVNIWYGITGYAVATGTGIFRIYNARHWLSDVVMGAGIGILTTKIAYWIFPYIDNHHSRCLFQHLEFDSILLVLKQLLLSFFLHSSSLLLDIHFQ